MIAAQAEGINAFVLKPETRYVSSKQIWQTFMITEMNF